jgi:hypothetical protein
MNSPAPARCKTQDAFAEFFAEAKQPVPTEDVTKRLRETKKLFSKVHHVTSSGFAQVGLPLKLRALVCAIFAASNGETRFKASLATLVYLLFRRGDGRTFDAKKSEVRRALRKLVEWQEAHVTFCTVLPGGRVKGAEGYEYEDTQFELACLDGLAAAYEQTKDHPNSERVGNAVNAALSEMMKLPPFNNRFDVKEPTLNDLQKRDEKTAITKALLAADKAETMHADPMAYVRQLTAKIIKEAEARFNAPKSPAPDTGGRLSPAEARRQKDVQRCVENDTPPVDSTLVAVTINEDGRESIHGVEASHSDGEKSKIAPKAKDNLTVLKNDTGAPSDAAACVSSFAVERFDVTMIDDARPKRSHPELYEVMTTAELQSKLSSLLNRNEKRRESLIIRPVASHFIQLDDLDEETLLRVKPFSLMAIETSPANYQAWLALPSDIGEEMRACVRARILRSLELADKCASGAMRLPDSFNCKPEHRRSDGSFPRVRLVHQAAGRSVTVIELERAGLLAPLEPSPLSVRRAPVRHIAPERWPNYMMKYKANGDVDRSRSDWNFALSALRRGFTESEVEARMLELSAKARVRRRSSYVRRTVERAARIISTT